MTTPHDPDRIIRLFLEQGPTELPDRVYDAVRSDIDDTRTRLPISVSLILGARARAGLPIVAAVMAVIAVVSTGLLTSNDVPGAAEQDPPSSPAMVFPGPGPLPAGTYGAIVDGVSFTFDLYENGWESSSVRPGELRADSYGAKDGEHRGSAWVGYGTVENVYADPCGGVPLSPPIGPSTADLVSALTTIPGTVSSEPKVMSTEGGSAQYLQLTAAEDADCRPEELELWYRDGQDIEGTSRGLRDEDSSLDVWIFDVGGSRFVVDRERTPGDLSTSLHAATTIHFQDLSSDELAYVEQVRSMCTAASDRFERDPDVVGGFRTYAPEFLTLDAAASHVGAASMILDSVIRELDALQVPASLRAEVSAFEDPLESTIEVLGQVAAAARGGDAERVSMLLTEAYRLSHAPYEDDEPAIRDERLLAPSFSGCVLPSGGG